MILKRKIYKKLLEWKKECQGKKALLIEGARRIGKSTICEEFGKSEYKSFLLIDFAKKDKEVEMYFERYLNDNEGMLYENAIAQMLVANGHKLYFYTHYNENKHRNDMEIDFIISNSSRLKYKMFPIEVKSGKQYKTTSLNNFREKYKERIEESYIIHPRNLIVKDGIICIPPYMTMNI